MSDSSEDELPEAAPVSTATRKMKPYVDAVTKAIEDTRDMKKNSHGVHKAVMDAVAAAKTSEEVQAFVEQLPTSNLACGKSHSMNRLVKQLQAVDLLPAGAKVSWSKASKAQKKAIWNIVTGLFSETADPVKRDANGAAMPTDEDDQDGHFFFNHPERGDYPAA